MPESTSTLPQIPRPQEVRARLAEKLREAKLLRSLLRVAERAEQERRQRQEAVQ